MAGSVQLQEGESIAPVWMMDRGSSFTPVTPNAEDQIRSEAQERKSRRRENSAVSITKNFPSFIEGWNNFGASCVIGCGASRERFLHRELPNSEVRWSRKAMLGRSRVGKPMTMIPKPVPGYENSSQADFFPPEILIAGASFAVRGTD